MTNGGLTEHEFGGLSTDLKLTLVGGYLQAFTTALTGKFKLWYIDAFAGTGERTVKHAAQDAGLWQASTEARIERLRGSARIAIETAPPFDRLIFIDTKRRHCEALEKLKLEHPNRNVTVVRANANDAIRTAIANTDWSGIRAVMFLDPYGMHVDWETLKAIQRTQAIDVWHLVSLAGLFRQAAKDGKALSNQKKAAITRMLGTTEWEDAWYEKRPSLDLFDQSEEISSRTATVEEIEAYVGRRLRDIFPKVLKPLRLRNTQNVPTFSLFFAISNPEPKAIGLASKIANSLLQKGSSSQVRPR